jgi:hypothetical protein
VRRALAAGASIDALPGVLASPLIQRLRETQVQLKADIADLSATLLDNHPRIRALRSQLAGLDSQIRNEAGKVLEGLDTEADAARLREVELTAELNRFKAESARVGEQEVELRALEREAAAQRDLLESYLTRYREAASRKDGNYLPADARTFSRASVPSEPYFPKVLPITFAAFAASLLVMALVTLLRELFSGRALRPAAAAEPVRDVPMPAFSPRHADASFASSAPDATEDATPVFTKGQITVEAAAERLIARGASRAIFVSPEGDEGAATAIMVAREVADASHAAARSDLDRRGLATDAGRHQPKGHHQPAVLRSAVHRHHPS